MKNLVKLTKGKVIAIIILTLWSFAWSFPDYPHDWKPFREGYVVANALSVISRGPGSLVYYYLTDKKSYDEVCNTPNETGLTLPCDFASVVIRPVFKINSQLGYSLVAFSNIVYWYLVVTAVSALIHFRKKPNPSGDQVRQLADSGKGEG